MLVNQKDINFYKSEGISYQTSKKKLLKMKISKKQLRENVFNQFIDNEEYFNQYLEKEINKWAIPFLKHLIMLTISNQQKYEYCEMDNTIE